MARSKARVLPGQAPLLSPVDLAGPTGLVILNKLRPEAESCTACPLHEGRERVVFGEGPWDHPRIAFVGEAPGSQEDEQGLPFVGPSGKLLDQILTAMGVLRASVYITNAVKCFPHDENGRARPPTGEELATCEHFLRGQLLAIKPKVIVALGKTAAYQLLPPNDRESMRYLRGRWHLWEKIKLRVTWHPAYVLRKDREDGGDARWQVWEDMVSVLEELNLSVPDRRRKVDP